MIINGSGIRKEFRKLTRFPNVKNPLEVFTWQ